MQATPETDPADQFSNLDDIAPESLGNWPNEGNEDSRSGTGVGYEVGANVSNH